jgi:hypothetical protein
MSNNSRFASKMIRQKPPVNFRKKNNGETTTPRTGGAASQFSKPATSPRYYFRTRKRTMRDMLPLFAAAIQAKNYVSMYLTRYCFCCACENLQPIAEAPIAR